ncbi:hypothetical protein [Micromonospora lutea]|uniref:Aminoglycoside phosphotransferase domain-containing protein n=1 Tax=Micromonospora lutea TaxID=419825 RepID=A0ABQ4IPV5_9ACTN|nr:hypothetical protein [Micromonospora lutea]GIJ19821.1 hypothetical protein Vlu01_04450 [Micromonospora lutea]
MGYRVANGHPAPDTVVLSAVREWANATDVQIVPEFAPDPHKSDAQLYCVSVTWRDDDGSTKQKYIVKVVPAETADELIAGHERAQRSQPPGFADRHIVKQPDWYRVDSHRRLLIQQVANGGDAVVSLAALSDDDRQDAIPRIVDALINDWNTPDTGRRGVRLRTRETTVGEFVQQEVAQLASVGSVLAAAARLGVTDNVGPVPDLDGVPNLLALLTHCDSRLARRTMDCLVGHTHGDLNGGNVLIPYERGKPCYGAFLLVDLGGYQSDGPLTRDAVFVLLSTLLRTVAPRSPVGGPAEVLPHDQADAIICCLVDPDTRRPGKLLPGLAQLIERVHRAGLNHAKKANYGSDWRQQWCLEVASQALVYLTFDDIGEAGHRWCLRLAAKAWEAYLRLVNASPAALAPEPPPSRAETATLPTPRPPLSRADDTVMLALRPPLIASSTPGADRRHTNDPGARFDQRWLTPWSRRHLWSVPLSPASDPATRPPDAAAETRRDAPSPWPANVTPVADRPEERGRAAHRRNSLHDDSANLGRAGGNRLRLPSVRLRTVVAAALAGMGLVGSAYLVMLPERRDELTAPTRTVTVTPTRDVPSAPGRSAERDPVLPNDLGEFAEYVANLVGETPPGRYACTRYEVLSWEHGEGRSKLTRHRYELWFTAERAGRRVVTEFGPTGSRRAVTTTFTSGKMTEVSPVPKENPETLRVQLWREWDKLVPELRTTNGMLQIVARIFLHHPLTPAQSAVLLEELAAMSGIEFAGSYTDDEGEPGVAFQAEDRDGRRDTLLFDSNGRLLRHDLTQGDLLLSRHHLIHATRTDTMDEPCL